LLTFATSEALQSGASLPFLFNKLKPACLFCCEGSSGLQHSIFC